MSRAISIDPDRQIVEAVEVNGLEDLHRAVGGYIEVAFVFGSRDEVLYVNEEGMLQRLTPWRFYWRDDQPLFGRGIVVGKEIEDNSVEGFHNADVVASVEDIRRLVRWIKSHTG